MDQLDEEYRTRFDYFKREERELQLRSARGNDKGAQVIWDNSPQRYRPSPVGSHSSVIATSAAPSQYYSSQDSRSDARVLQQLHNEILLRSFSPLD